MKKFGILLILLVFVQSIQAQKYMSQNGVISFFSSTPVEDIEAINNQVSAALNTENGEIASALLMKAFNFEKALMQEHFNEKFVESEKFPKSTFKGQIVDFENLNLNDKPQKVKLKGTLTLQGVTKDIDVEGTMSKANSVMDLKFQFDVLVADYDIQIPGSVRENIAKTIKINGHFKMNEM